MTEKAIRHNGRLYENTTKLIADLRTQNDRLQLELMGANAAARRLADERDGYQMAAWCWFGMFIIAGSVAGAALWGLL